MQPVNRLRFLIKKTVFMVCSILLLLFSSSGLAMRIGVTLHPYYSYVANIVGDKDEVIAIVPTGFNPHAYEPRGEDIKRINTLDVIVINGIGHDDFIERMVQASENKKIPLIEANLDVPLLSTMGIDGAKGQTVNAHTFLSISASIIQINSIAKALGTFNPDNAQFYTDNARRYTQKLRKMRALALEKMTQLPDRSFRVATVHGAYDYLFREFGLEVAAVIEPAHGIEPSPSQLKKVIKKLTDYQINVLFAEQDNPSPYVKTLQEETGLKMYSLTHISHGPYTPEAFEVGMQHNLDTIVQAISDSQPW